MGGCAWSAGCGLSQPHLVLLRRSDEAFFGRRRTRHEETHQNPISFVTHSLTVQHHGGPSALRRRITIFSYQIHIQYHVWIYLKLTVSSYCPPLRINATNHRPTFPPSVGRSFLWGGITAPSLCSSCSRCDAPDPLVLFHVVVDNKRPELRRTLRMADSR